MKKTLYSACITGLLSMFLCACSSSNKEQANYSQTSESAAVADSTFSNSESPALEDQAARQSGNENFSLNSKTNLEKTGRKFIRTADVKCKVKNVRQATNQVEDLTARFNGFITNSNLQSTVDRVESIPVSTDSTLEAKTYTVLNDMVLRVPNTRLDSLMRELNSLIDFLDYRVIKAEDASLELLANQMQGKRLESYSRRVTGTIDKQGKKVSESINAEENLLNRQNQLDETVVRNLGLEDQIAYSTVHLQIYQRETVFKEIIVNPNNIDAYRPGLFVRMGESFIEGWHIFEEILVFFSRLWFLFVLGISGWLLYRRFGKRSKGVAISSEQV